MRTPGFAALVLAGACLLASTGCTTPTEVDSDGRWVGGGEVMTAWAEAQVPATWDRVDQSVKYIDIIDDLGKDTQRDRTSFAAKYRGVTQDEFAEFGSDTLEISQDLECEPFDAASALPEEKVYLEDCYLSLYQGESPLPDEFDLFAVWTSFPDGSTTTELYLTNDPV